MHGWSLSLLRMGAMTRMRGTAGVLLTHTTLLTIGYQGKSVCARMEAISRPQLS